MTRNRNLETHYTHNPRLADTGTWHRHSEPGSASVKVLTSTNDRFNVYETRSAARALHRALSRQPIDQLDEEPEVTGSDAVLHQRAAGSFRRDRHAARWKPAMRWSLRRLQVDAKVDRATEARADRGPQRRRLRRRRPRGLRRRRHRGLQRARLRHDRSRRHRDRADADLRARHGDARRGAARRPEGQLDAHAQRHRAPPARRRRWASSGSAASARRPPCARARSA